MIGAKGRSNSGSKVSFRGYYNFDRETKTAALILMEMERKFFFVFKY